MPTDRNVLLLMDIETARLVWQAVALFIVNDPPVMAEDKDRLYAVSTDLSKRIVEKSKR